MKPPYKVADWVKHADRDYMNPTGARLPWKGDVEVATHAHVDEGKGASASASVVMHSKAQWVAFVIGIIALIYGAHALNKHYDDQARDRRAVNAEVQYYMERDPLKAKQIRCANAKDAQQALLFCQP